MGALQLHAGAEDTQPVFALSTIAASLGFFIAGVLFFGQLANALRVTHRRWWLVSSSLVQTAFVAIAAVLQYQYQEAADYNDTLARITISLIAFSSGTQVGMVRGLKTTDITTAMATAAYIDIFIAPRLLAGLSENRGRNRRVGFLVVLVGCSFVGAAASKEIKSSFALAISAVIKAIVSGLFLFNEPATESII